MLMCYIMCYVFTLVQSGHFKTKTTQNYPEQNYPEFQSDEFTHNLIRVVELMSHYISG